MKLIESRVGKKKSCLGGSVTTRSWRENKKLITPKEKEKKKQ